MNSLPLRKLFIRITAHAALALSLFLANGAARTGNERFCLRCGAPLTE